MASRVSRGSPITRRGPSPSSDRLAGPVGPGSPLGRSTVRPRSRVVASGLRAPETSARKRVVAPATSCRGGAPSAHSLRTRESGAASRDTDGREAARGAEAASPAGSTTSGTQARPRKRLAPHATAERHAAAALARVASAVVPAGSDAGPRHHAKAAAAVRGPLAGGSAIVRTRGGLAREGDGDRHPTPAPDAPQRAPAPHSRSERHVPAEAPRGGGSRGTQAVAAGSPPQAARSTEE